MSVSVEQLDDDHKAALEMMSELRRLILGRDQAAAAEQLKRLIHHDREHFAREERMLSEIGFPALAGHRDGHRAAERLLAHLAEALAAADWAAAERSFAEMCSGFVGLIADDIEYKWFLIDRGVRPRFAGTRIDSWEPLQAEILPALSSS